MRSQITMYKCLTVGENWSTSKKDMTMNLMVGPISTQMNGGDGLLPTGTYYYIVKVYATGDTYTGYVYITK